MGDFSHVLLISGYLPMSTAISQMARVTPKALTGSPPLESVSKGLRNGIIWSLEMAWRSLGAPVKDCKPAPHVERSDPISTTFGWGQAMLPTTKLPPMLSPNLQRRKSLIKNAHDDASVNYASAKKAKMPFMSLDLLVSQKKGIHSGCKQKNRRQIHSGSHQNGHDGSDRNRLLRIGQVTRAIRSSHDT